MIFQSTHPLRGATMWELTKIYDESISIHAPLAGCDLNLVIRVKNLYHFNPRTPRGVRPSIYVNCADIPSFQSTHPSRGATRQLRKFTSRRIISIHAPLAGCDKVRTDFARRHQHFNPRTPRGVRLKLPSYTERVELFQSTHPSRGAT